MDYFSIQRQRQRESGDGERQWRRAAYSSAVARASRKQKDNDRAFEQERKQLDELQPELSIAKDALFRVMTRSGEERTKLQKLAKEEYLPCSMAAPRIDE